MTILVGADCETVPDKAVRIGNDLAEQYDEELVVLHVMPQDMFEKHREAVTGDTDSDNLVGLSGGYNLLDEPSTTAGSSDSYTVQDGQHDAAISARPAFACVPR